MASACWPREALQERAGPSRPKRTPPAGRRNRLARASQAASSGPSLPRSSGHHCSGLLKPTLTNDNRASAAEMLGLSRQSLYVKLRRYGIGDLTAADPA